MTEDESQWIAGLDGCPAGWITVLRDVSGRAAPTCTVLKTLADIDNLPQRPAVIAIDMPIGLPEHVGPGGRGCDVAARKVLGARQSSVFAVPARVAVMEEDYWQACALAAANSTPSRKVSKQCFYLFPKIREVDAWIGEHGQERIYECHPEVAFWAMNGQVALTEPKKVKSRPYGPGLALRRDLLVANGYAPDFVATCPFKRKDATEDDFLDACATAWSAERILKGHAMCFPDTPATDDRGIPMTIWA